MEPTNSMKWSALTQPTMQLETMQDSTGSATHNTSTEKWGDWQAQDRREEDSESKEKKTIKLDQAEELTGKEETFLSSKDIVDLHNNQQLNTIYQSFIHYIFLFLLIFLLFLENQ